MADIDVTNNQLVGRSGDGTIYVGWPRARMTKAEALTHAA